MYVQIEYKTDPTTPALYWLKPNQTSDGKHPLLISRSKLTFARGIFPCQDTPSHLFTFTATIVVPLGFSVIMFGTMITKYSQRNITTYKFKQMNPISSYAVILVVGNLHDRRMLKRPAFHLWAEEKYLMPCTLALRKINSYLRKSEIAKELEDYGCNLRSDTFIVFVLPPNVPEPDVQYPYVIFVSSVIAEETKIDRLLQNILESWISSRISIKNFELWWLIKSFSMFINRRILTKWYEEQEGYLEIKERLDVLNTTYLNRNIYVNHEIQLVPYLSGTLPSEIINNVPYEKGCLLLNHVQCALGYESFKNFFKYYHRTCRRDENQILNTAHFKQLLYRVFDHKIQVLNSVDWNMWLVGQHLPLHEIFSEILINIFFDTKMFITEQSGKMLYSVTKLQSNASKFNKITFLSYLNCFPTYLPVYKLHILKYAYLGNVGNNEIRFLWLHLCIKSKWSGIIQDALQFATDNICIPYYACSIMSCIYEWKEMRHLSVMWFETNHSKMSPKIIRELEFILQVKLNV
ncbi:PREDICTED: leukotriene A-4 hydrolase-like [Vollenhovia emeryi]|uniref:leukotriene A-4 hydrolase-like n=1 Tax=Vollenhovia emeryi TaxID=411798 RepID=UPI0005F47AE8|nr:PREDICTED: leukotriene A-4 hydrolase-like [Vollenhovia emeryi]XP_011869814.1 PREDICTED: leukotriene A-4 hydrolase-like [Vollenhovia emeryi]